jgi:hypothetical protein
VSPCICAVLLETTTWNPKMLHMQSCSLCCVNLSAFVSCHRHHHLHSWLSVSLRTLRRACTRAHTPVPLQFYPLRRTNVHVGVNWGIRTANVTLRTAIQFDSNLVLLRAYAVQNALLPFVSAKDNHDVSSQRWNDRFQVTLHSKTKRQNCKRPVSQDNAKRSREADLINA